MAGDRVRRFALIGLVVVMACIGASRIPSLASDATPASTVQPAADTPLCFPGQACVAVDGAVGLGAASQRANGFLHGVDARTSPSRVLALHPTSWRSSGGQNEHTLISLYTPTTTAILNDYWTRATWDKARGGGKLPWADWDAYRTFVTNLVRQAKQQGWAPTYWEIQNEPDSWLGYAPPVHATVANALQLFEVGYAAVKAGDPTAKVIGPSLSGFLATHSNARPEILDMTTFLDFIAREHLRFDAISWHETEPDYMPVAERRPEAIAGHVATMRQMLAARPSLGNPAIFINEYMYPANIPVPGWRVGYIAALEAANVDRAAMSCPLGSPVGTGCFVPDLDGLLESNGSTPLPAYWVMFDYANMTGTRVATWSYDSHMSAFATRVSTAAGPVQVLLGRHQSCTTAVNPECHDPYTATPPPVDLTVAVRVGGADRAAVVTIEHIPDSGRAMQLPETPKFLNVPVRGGVARVPIANFTDGEAYSLTVV